MKEKISLKSKKAFTLIEIMIVIACIALLAGFITINIRLAVLEQNFESQTSELLSQLRLAEELSTLFNVDVEVQFSEEYGKTKSLMVATGVITETFEALLKNSERTYDFRATWEGTQFKNDSTFSLNFYDQGYHFPLGVLKIEGSKTLYLTLPGYPTPLKFTEEEKSVREIEQKNMELYDHLTPFVMQDPHVHT